MKTIRLSPINSGHFNEIQELNQNVRVFNLDQLDIKYLNHEFILLSPSGEITLKENDEILIQGILFRVSFIEKTFLFNHQDENSDFTEHELDQDETQIKLFSSEENEDHPLAFLFKKNSSEN